MHFTATENEKAQCDIGLRKEHHPSKSNQSVNGYLISICYNNFQTYCARDFRIFCDFKYKILREAYIEYYFKFTIYL